VALVLGKALSVYRWQTGIHLCNALVAPDKTELLGRTLARVHLATPRLSQVGSGRFGLDGIAARLDGIAASAPRFEPDVALLRAKLSEYSARRDRALPAGLIHGDLFRDNVLFQGDAIAALLDFESASFGPFAYDVAVCLLAWCYTDGLRFDCAAGLLAGYHAERPLSARELEQLEVEGAIACLRFATTRISDFSLRAAPGEQPRRDYRRFLDRLRDLEAGAFRDLVRDFSGSVSK
jgi:homoserine kinase type II